MSEEISPLSRSQEAVVRKSTDSMDALREKPQQGIRSAQHVIQKQPKVEERKAPSLTPKEVVEYLAIAGVSYRTVEELIQDEAGKGDCLPGLRKDLQDFRVQVAKLKAPKAFKTEGERTNALEALEEDLAVVIGRLKEENPSALATAKKTFDAEIKDKQAQAKAKRGLAQAVGEGKFGKVEAMLAERLMQGSLKEKHMVASLQAVNALNSADEEDDVQAASRVIRLLDITVATIKKFRPKLLTNMKAALDSPASRDRVDLRNAVTILEALISGKTPKKPERKVPQPKTRDQGRKRTMRDDFSEDQLSSILGNYSSLPQQPTEQKQKAEPQVEASMELLEESREIYHARMETVKEEREIYHATMETVEETVERAPANNHLEQQNPQEEAMDNANNMQPPLRRNGSLADLLQIERIDANQAQQMARLGLDPVVRQQIQAPANNVLDLQQAYLDRFTIQTVELPTGLRIRNWFRRGRDLTEIQHAVTAAAQANLSAGQELMRMGIPHKTVAALVQDGAFDWTDVEGDLRSLKPIVNSNLQLVQKQMKTLGRTDARLVALERDLLEKLRIIEIGIIIEEGSAPVQSADLTPGKKAEAYAASLTKQLIVDSNVLHADSLLPSAIVEVKSMTTKEGIYGALLAAGHKSKDAKKLAREVLSHLNESPVASQILETLATTYDVALKRTVDGAALDAARQAVINKYPAGASRETHLRLADAHVARMAEIASDPEAVLQVMSQTTPATRLEKQLQTAVETGSLTAELAHSVTETFLKNEREALEALVASHDEDQAPHALAAQIVGFDALTSPLAPARAVAAVHGPQIAMESAKASSRNEFVGQLMSHSDSAKAMLQDLMPNEAGREVIETIFAKFPNRNHRAAQIARLTMGKALVQPHEQRQILNESPKLPQALDQYIAKTQALYGLWRDGELTIQDLRNYANQGLGNDKLMEEAGRQAAAIEGRFFTGAYARRFVSAQRGAFQRVAEEMVAGVAREEGDHDKAAIWRVLRDPSAGFVAGLETAQMLINHDDLNDAEVGRLISAEMDAAADKVTFGKAKAREARLQQMAEVAVRSTALYITFFSEVDPKLNKMLASDLAQALPKLGKATPQTNVRLVGEKIIGYAQSLQRQFLRDDDQSLESYLGISARLHPERIETVAREAGLDSRQIRDLFELINPRLVEIREVMRDKVDDTNVEGAEAPDAPGVQANMEQRAKAIRAYVNKEQAVKADFEKLIAYVNRFEGKAAKLGIAPDALRATVATLNQTAQAMQPRWNQLGGIDRDAIKLDAPYLEMRGEVGVAEEIVQDEVFQAKQIAVQGAAESLAYFQLSEAGRGVQEALMTYHARYEQVEKVLQAFDGSKYPTTDDKGQSLVDRARLLLGQLDRSAQLHATLADLPDSNEGHNTDLYQAELAAQAGVDSRNRLIEELHTLRS